MYGHVATAPSSDSTCSSKRYATHTYDTPYIPPPSFDKPVAAGSDVTVPRASAVESNARGLQQQCDAARGDREGNPINVGNDDKPEYGDAHTAPEQKPPKRTVWTAVRDVATLGFSAAAAATSCVGLTIKQLLLKYKGNVQKQPDVTLQTRQNFCNDKCTYTHMKDNLTDVLNTVPSVVTDTSDFGTWLNTMYRSALPFVLSSCNDTIPTQLLLTLASSVNVTGMNTYYNVNCTNTALPMALYSFDVVYEAGMASYRALGGTDTNGRDYVIAHNTAGYSMAIVAMTFVALAAQAVITFIRVCAKSATRPTSLAARWNFWLRIFFTVVMPLSAILCIAFLVRCANFTVPSDLYTTDTIDAHLTDGCKSLYMATLVLCAVAALLSATGFAWP